MEARSIVFVESNTTGTGELFIKESLVMGYNVFFLSKDPFKYPFLEKYPIHYVQINTENVDGMIRMVEGIPSVDLVFSSSEFFVEIVNQINMHLRLISNRPEAISICRNKLALYEVLSKKGLCPKAIRVLRSTVLGNTASDFMPYPFVVKPLKGSGSQGVRFIRDADQLAIYANEIDQDEFIVQEYMDGEEFSVEVLSLHGEHHVMGITRKYLGEEPYFIETGHDFPADLPRDETEKICCIVREALDEIGYVTGASHIEIRVKRQTVKIIEINPRLAGGMIPVLMNKCTNINMIRLCLLVHLNKIEEFAEEIARLTFLQKGVIRFKLAESKGEIEKIIIRKEEKDDRLDHEILLLKKSGDRISLSGDFKDRIACVIVAGSDTKECEQVAKGWLCRVEAVYRDRMDPSLADHTLRFLENTGRLRSTIHPYAQAVMKAEKRRTSLEEIRFICDIDEAHQIMLLESGILPHDDVISVLSEIQRLREFDFESVLRLPAPRGLYLTYESYMIAQLGERLGGNLQLARSRNDINATMNHLFIRDHGLELIQTLWRLMSSMTLLARKYVNTVFPIYSQYQTALPGTFGHYLMAIVESLLDHTHKWISLLECSLKSPLGAGSGGGTTLPINTNITAQLLGFKTGYRNSIAAVSSRDLNLRVASECSFIGLTLSRFIQDLQIWSSIEFSLCSLPDQLCGGSSAMPQKKNPYLLEWVKARIDELLAVKDTLTFSIHKTPFSNSFEVSGISTDHSCDMISKVTKVIRMTSILVNGLAIHEKSAKKHLMDSHSYLSDIAEYLFREHSISFRESHHYLGEIIPLIGADYGALVKLVNQKFGIQMSQVLPSQDRLYGMGPGEKQVNEHISYCMDSLEQIKDQLDDVSQQIRMAYRKKEQLIYRMVPST
ncbi:lyase family protein [Thermoactinomyces sp. DSM 45892]|uniref:lyase family protein n=1 Tax=Thermoactinomyces sp. DSM 45892 TaxID=1882753 RepID=UPI00089CD28A|nr:lyase family protein [Thermoactinomyces sp. DSM 45892]SDZ33483.1 argininosuccinate lyase [Thermoactinomyces sp. DSM 45892]